MAETTAQRATAVATAVSAEGTIITTSATAGGALNNNVNSLPTVPSAGISQVIRGVLNITAGAGTTAVVVKCRRGTGTGGTQVGTSQTHTLAATNSANIAFEFQDVSSPLSGVYTITITQTGGTGAGTVNEIVVSVCNYE